MVNVETQLELQEEEKVPKDGETACFPATMKAVGMAGEGGDWRKVLDLGMA